MFTNIVTYVLTSIEVLCCILLMIVILLQKSKSQGAGLAFGAAVGETLFGGQAGNVLSKITTVLLIIFLVNTTILAYLGSKRRTAGIDDGLDSPRPAQTTPGPVQGGPAPMPSAAPVAPVEIPVSSGQGSVGTTVTEPIRIDATAQPVPQTPAPADKPAQ